MNANEIRDGASASSGPCSLGPRIQYLHENCWQGISDDEKWRISGHIANCPSCEALFRQLVAADNRKNSFSNKALGVVKQTASGLVAMTAVNLGLLLYKMMWDGADRDRAEWNKHHGIGHENFPENKDPRLNR